MTQKHKSKYKAPKDLEKSRKLTARKDLKDYTMDDKKGAMNPKSTGEKQLGVLRKRDKEMVDTGKTDVKYDADDRLYAKIEDGDYDPKTAAKRLKKRSEKEEKDTADVLKDKIENLTREQREYLVREYVRRKIQKVLQEQAAATDTPEDQPAETPTDTATPAPDAAAPAAPDAAATAPTPATPPTDTATPPATDTAAATPPADTATPPAGEKPAADAEEKEVDPETKEVLDTDRFVKSLKKMPGTVEKIKAIANVTKLVTSEMEYEDTKNFFQMLRTYAINKLERLGSDKKTKK
jgi:hypothetical protein